jgi:phenylacetic acid degradation operon negative regulatory protein
MMQDSNTPLTARSVLASTLLGVDPPELPVSYLVHVGGLFGISENGIRVALSRMVGSGEATSDGAGRYRLSGHLLHRQHRQQASRVGRLSDWKGDWRMVVVTKAGSSAEARAERRRGLALARLAELRDGMWLRPNNIEVRLDSDLEHDVIVFFGAPERDPFQLVAELWDLRGWSAKSSDLIEQMEGFDPKRPPDLAPGFELSASVLRHLQADPLLPPELLPTAWPGTTLRRRYDDWDVRYREVLAHWSRTA